MYCNVYNYVAFCLCSKQDEGEGGDYLWYLYRVTVWMHLLLLLLHSTDDRSGGREKKKNRHRVEKTSSCKQSCVAVLENRERERGRERERQREREMETAVVCCVSTYKYGGCKCRTKSSTNKSLLGSSMDWVLWRWRQICLTKEGVECVTGGNSGHCEWLGVAPSVMMLVVLTYDSSWASLVDVLREPAEALAVALPLQHAAHEHLQWSCVQLL